MVVLFMRFRIDVACTHENAPPGSLRPVRAKAEQQGVNQVTQATLYT